MEWIEDHDQDQLIFERIDGRIIRLSIHSFLMEVDPVGPGTQVTIQRQ